MPLELKKKNKKLTVNNKSNYYTKISYHDGIYQSIDYR